MLASPALIDSSAANLSFSSLVFGSVKMTAFFGLQTCKTEESAVLARELILANPGSQCLPNRVSGSGSDNTCLPVQNMFSR